MEFNTTCGFNINQANYYWYESGFSDEELLWVDNLKNLYPFEHVDSINIISSEAGPTSYSGDKKIIKRIKSIGNKSQIIYDDNCLWLYDKLKVFAIEANNMGWGFNIHSIIEPIRHIEYLEGSEVNWHLDIGYGINYRKITIIAQLSDPGEYEGGDIELWNGENSIILPKNKGATILFPSFLSYRVTPIISGVKKTLEFFICGDSFK